MFDFHEKRKIRTFLYSKVVIGALFLGAVFLSFSVYDRYIVAEEMQAKLEDKRAQLEELQNRAELLESKVEYFKNDRGIEEELRNRFDVAKEGEQVIVLIDSKESGTHEAQGELRVETPLQHTEEESFFSRFFNF